jgi:hypothetical protein
MEIISGEVVPIKNIIGKIKINEDMTTAGINEKTEAILYKELERKVKDVKNNEAIHITQIKTAFLFCDKLSFPPKKYPEANPAKVTAITELHTYKLLPK